LANLQIKSLHLRSIKDKSVLFDNSLKELKDHMREVEYKCEQEVRTLTQQLTKNQAKDQTTSHITGRITASFHTHCHTLRIETKKIYY
jgi:hypothetical protein